MPRKSTKTADGSTAVNLTLHFSTPDELAIYKQLVEGAKADFDRPLSKYAMITLRRLLSAPSVFSQLSPAAQNVRFGVDTSVYDSGLVANEVK